MMTIDRLLEKLDPASPILQATFGLERESLRVTEAGTLAALWALGVFIPIFRRILASNSSN